MSLDKLTLHAQLVLLAKNAESLDVAIATKENALHQLAADLERTRGARQYHELLVQQVKQTLAEANAAEQATTPA